MPFPTVILSAEVRALTDCLLAVPIGGTVTYAEMSEAIGADVLARRYLILRAIKVSLRESGAIYSVVTRVGYRRLSAEEAHTLGGHARTSIRRTSRRAVQAISGAIAVSNDISDEARRRAFAEISVLQLVQHISADRARAAVKDTSRPLPVALTMRAMVAKIGATQESDAAA